MRKINRLFLMNAFFVLLGIFLAPVSYAQTQGVSCQDQGMGIYLLCNGATAYVSSTVSGSINSIIIANTVANDLATCWGTGWSGSGPDTVDVEITVNGTPYFTQAKTYTCASNLLTSSIDGTYTFSTPPAITSGDSVGVLFRSPSSGNSLYSWSNHTNWTATLNLGSPFSANARQAVVLEAFYALRPSHDGGCDQTISYQGYSDCVSSWNFLNDSSYPGPLAMSTLVPLFGVDASDWAVSTDTYYANGDTNSSPSFYSDLADYGYSTAGGSNGSVGRGGQCMFFANNILYRSQSDQSTLNYSTMSASADSNLQDVQMGNVLFLYNDSNSGFTTNHVAIVVQIYQTAGVITALDVIDSNYVPDITGTPNREVIARHSFCTGAGTCPFTGVQVIQDNYQIWTGTQYYSTTY